jgi:uncharacterized protein (DUF433 family)
LNHQNWLDKALKNKEYQMQRITLEAGKRGGRPCIRGLRISVYDILAMLSNGESQASIIEDFPELEPQDIQAALSYAADRERRV